MTDPLGLISSAGGAHPVSPNKPASVQDPEAKQSEPTESLKKVLLENIEQVNKLQQDADMAIEDLQAGRRDDVANVMIAKQKADMAFQMLLQVRNKMVDAYEEIKQMRV
jgi:flagellar hook-basal body complex protein FliE